MSVDRQHLVEDWEPYQELFSWAPLGYARLTLDGRVLEMNYTGADLLETTTGRVAGQPFLAFVARPDRARFLDHLARARDSRETTEDAIELCTGNSHHFPARVCTRRSPRDPAMCWMIFADLGPDRALGAPVDHAARDRFVAALSHELRTPLTPVLMATSMLSGLQGLPGPAAAIIDTIRRNVEREAHLLDNLLDVTGLTRHTMLFDRQFVDAHALLRDAITACAAEARGKGLEIVLHASATSARIHADPTRMRQAFHHLLANAVKFTESGRIAVMTSNDRPDTLRIAVADSGPGLDPAGIEAMFAPLEPRVAGGVVAGLGFGLAICKGIVEAHGGSVAASSAGSGLGATFEIVLPLAGAPESGRAPAESATKPNGEHRGPASGGLRILVVEDHADSGAMLDLLLSSRGHVVSIATSVAGALARRDEPWDVVISDLGLPDGSGLEIGRVMRTLARPPRLIALSGYGRPTDVAASHDAGFDIHLVKPLDPDRLFEILDAAR